MIYRNVPLWICLTIHFTEKSAWKSEFDRNINESFQYQISVTPVEAFLVHV